MFDFIQKRLLLDNNKKQEQFRPISIQNFDNLLQQLQSQNKQVQKQISQYQKKINQLPLQLKRKVQAKLQYNLSSDSVDQQSQQFYDFNQIPLQQSLVSKALLSIKIKNLQQQQRQINFISKLTDVYLRCKKQAPVSSFSQIQQSVSQNKEFNIHHHKSTLERQELEGIAEFLQNIKPYQDDGDSNKNDIINELVSNIKIHTSKKLAQKCQNLIYLKTNQKLVIQKYLIEHCKTIILGNQINSFKQLQKQSQIKQIHQKSVKILNKYIQKILTNIIYYDVTYQKIIVMQILNPQQINEKQTKHQQTIRRKKVYFLPTQTDKHFQTIKFTLKYHLEKIKQIKSLLFSQSSNQSNQLSIQFDKIVQKYISQIKGNLQYILPYLNIKSRKQLINILNEGKDQTIQFQDLILRLKFKGQDGDMFMNNLEAVFNRLIEFKNQDQLKRVVFSDKHFQTLISFFQLGIFQAQQSLFQTSSRAFSKLTTGISKFSSNFKRDSNSQPVSLKSKKLFNIIFSSVQTLILKFDQLIDENPQVFNNEQNSKQQQKIQDWTYKLVEIRQNVRKKIYME